MFSWSDLTSLGVFWKQNIMPDTKVMGYPEVRFVSIIMTLMEVANPSEFILLGLQVIADYSKIIDFHEEVMATFNSKFHTIDNIMLQNLELKFECK